MRLRTITPTIAIADQPTETELEALKAEGYVGIVNLRHDGEPEQPLSTAAEADKVRGLGMDYLHYGVGGGPLSPSGVAAVSDFLDAHAEGPVLVHCRRGPRAAALVLLHLARTHGWAPVEALAQGRTHGLEVEGGLRTLVESYLHQHASPS